MFCDVLDIDECVTISPCEGTCQDTTPGYNCSCPIGEKLQTDQTSCSGNEMVIF